MFGSPARRDDAAAYRLDCEENDLVIRIPSALPNRDRVSQFLDYLILEQGVASSRSPRTRSRGSRARRK